MPQGLWFGENFMQSIFDRVLREVDIGRLMDDTAALTRLERGRLERGQTFEDHRRAAEFAAGRLRDAGLDDVLLLEFPADGRTVYQDKCMPLAWSATEGRLTITRCGIPFDDPVVADYRRHPFHLVKGSVATPAGGVSVRIITEPQLFTGEDAAGCLVMTNASTRPRSDILRAALDLGALGIVSDYLQGRHETPDGIQWVNACTDAMNHPWHVQADDRPFIAFTVSPRIGEQLRDAASLGLGTVRLMDAAQLHELGVRAARRDPDIFLCDSADCLFCSEHRRTTAGNSEGR